MHQYFESNLDGNPSMLVWWTNISVQDVNQAVQHFLRNYRDDPSYLEGKYVCILKRVITVCAFIFNHSPLFNRFYLLYILCVDVLYFVLTTFS